MANKNPPSEDLLDKVTELKKKVDQVLRANNVKSRSKQKMEQNESTKMNDSNEDQKQEQKRKKIKASDFKIVKIIGKGAFGEVRMVRSNDDNAVYAMKTANKKMLTSKINHCAFSGIDKMLVDSRWLVKVCHSFQDDSYSYVVTEYCAGGSLMDFLIKKDILNETQTCFYMAQLTAAIDAVHERDLVYRDLTPEKILIGNDGHIKLSDFEFKKSYYTLTDQMLRKYEKMQASGKETADSGQRKRKISGGEGNPNYIAPEVFSQKGYDKMVDWWSMGVIMFECLVGYTPFNAVNYMQTCRKIVHYRKYFKIPHDIKLTREAVDLIHNLVCSHRRRYSLKQIKNHSFFKSVPFNDLTSMKPPFVPKLQTNDDTSYFEEIYEEQDIDTNQSGSASTAKDHFWGFTFKRPLDMSSAEINNETKKMIKENAELTETMEKVTQMKRRVERTISSKINYANQRRQRSLRLQHKMKDNTDNMGTIGLSMGGAKDVNTFRACMSSNTMPASSSITYNGILSEYYFETGNDRKENDGNLFYPSYCYANCMNWNDRDVSDYYLTVGLNSNLKMSEFKRKKLNLLICLDKSGSMGSRFSCGDHCNGNKMNVANQAVIALLSHLKKDDRFGLVTFDSTARVLQKMQFVCEIDMETLKKDISEISASGGTSFADALRKCTEMYNFHLFETDAVITSSYSNRMIFLTDAQFDGVSLIDELANNCVNAAHNIYTTFIGVGLDFNSGLIQTISDTRGCNYFSVKSSEEFREQMCDSFDYMVTPLVFNVELKLKCEGNSCEIRQIYGNNGNNDDCIGNGGTITKIHTLFPSAKRNSKLCDKVETVVETKGGIQLIELKKLDNINDSINDSINVEIIVSFEDANGKRFSNSQFVNFENENKSKSDMIENDDYFDNLGIRKAVLLCKYVELIKMWCDQHRNNKNKKLQITNDLKTKFDKFGKWFEYEMKICDDQDLEKELDIVRKIANCEVVVINDNNNNNNDNNGNNGNNQSVNPNGNQSVFGYTFKKQ